MSTLFISTESSSSLSSHSWLPAQFLSAAITKYPRPGCVLRMEMTLLAILEAGVLKTKVVLTSSRGRRAREDRAQPLHEGWRPTHTGCDVRTFFFFLMAPPFHLATPLSTFYPVGFGELFRSPAKGSEFQDVWLWLTRPALKPTPYPGSCVSCEFYSFIYFVFLRPGLIL